MINNFPPGYVSKVRCPWVWSLHDLHVSHTHLPVETSWRGNPPRLLVKPGRLYFENVDQTLFFEKFLEPNVEKEVSWSEVRSTSDIFGFPEERLCRVSNEESFRLNRVLPLSLWSHVSNFDHGRCLNSHVELFHRYFFSRFVSSLPLFEVELFEVRKTKVSTKNEYDENTITVFIGVTVSLH